MNLMAKNVESGDHEQEKKEQPPILGPLLSSSSYHHHHQQPFFPPLPLGGWLSDCGGPSSDQNEQLGWVMVEREHMFDKVVTPSDVGKLNRLVIPKQHAERYFPLDSSTNYKGLLLNFEDKNGKLWRFQYSYWNSSQSYVMTKGWSRFVKEKKLDAGDVVSFQRGVGVTAKDRLFIDWKRRVNPSSQPHHGQLPPPPSSSSSAATATAKATSDLAYMFHNHNFIHPWNPLVLQSLPASRNFDFMIQEPSINPSSSSSRSVYFRPHQFKMIQRCELGLGFDHEHDPAAPPVVHGRSSGKRLRLFGVNMECVFSKDEDDLDTTVTGCSTGNSLIPSSSSPSTIPYLQLTTHDDHGPEAECNQSTILTPSFSHDFYNITKSAVSNISLDLKMSQTESEI